MFDNNLRDPAAAEYYQLCNTNLHSHIRTYVAKNNPLYALLSSISLTLWAPLPPSLSALIPRYSLSLSLLSSFTSIMKFLLGSQILLRPLTNKRRLQSQCQSQASGSAWLGYRTQGVFLPHILPRRRRCLVVKAASAAEGGSRRPASARRVYRESQSASSLPVAPVKQLASFVVPAASFFAVTFGTEFAFNSFCVCVCVSS